MEDRRGRNGRMSVPQFGSWENQGVGGGGGGGGGGPNPADGYSMVFTKARADRKEQKAKTVPAHIAMNHDENDAQHPSSKSHYDHHGGVRLGHHQRHRNHHRQGQEPRRHSHQLSQEEAAGKKNILTYLNCCCIKP